jgi:NAD(P)-dependent dehydrogenase (short-subunit alcohol dehydrogenase family)
MTEKTIVLITGGNTGIGYETVKALYASSGPHVILMGSRSLEKAHAAIKTLQSEVTESNSEVIPIQIDIEDDTSIETLNKEIESKYGRLDALVNNAGKRERCVNAATVCASTNVAKEVLMTLSCGRILHLQASARPLITHTRSM